MPLSLFFSVSSNVYDSENVGAYYLMGIGLGEKIKTL